LVENVGRRRVNQYFLFSINSLKLMGGGRGVRHTLLGKRAMPGVRANSI
jgi:hypothetical protein